MKCIQKIGLILLPIVFCLAGIVSVSSLYAQPETIDFCQDKERGPVTFPHEQHMDGYECLDCHHDMQNGENVLDEGDLEEGNPSAQCSSCHNSKAKIKAREAFHRQCMGCHDRFKMTTQTTGPSLCGECHILTK